MIKCKHKCCGYIVRFQNDIPDAIISPASMASNVYVRIYRTARATISAGVSVNDPIPVFIARFGGRIRKALGIGTLFILPAALGLRNSAYAAAINTGKKNHSAGKKR